MANTGGRAPPERGTISRFQLYNRVKILQVHDRVEKSVI